MSLKKFSTFINEKDGSCEIKEPSNSSIKKKKKIKKVSKNKLEEEINYKQFDKIVEFNKFEKPSNLYNYLLNEKKSKDEINFIISTQPNNSLCIFKYNENNEFDLLKFSKELFSFYGKNEKLLKLLEKIKITGSSHFTSISNLPNKTSLEMIKKDFIKLLKK